MSFFELQTKTVAIVDDQHQVTLRKPTAEQKQKAASAAMKADAAARELYLDMPKFRLEQLAMGVIAWEGPGFAGRSPTPENIKALPEEVYNQIAEEWVKFVEQTVTEEVKKP